VLNRPVVAAIAAAAVLAGGCAGGSGSTGGSPTERPTPTATPSTARTSATSPTSVTSAPVTSEPPPERGFVAHARPLTAAERAAMTGVSWHPGCPVPLDDLRVVRLTFRDFVGVRRTGRLVVNADVVEDVRAIFGRLYELDFPIRRMRPVDAYGGDDFTSIEADNTSAFNCRAATGSDEWSHHAYGVAIDLNPLENPYVLGGRTIHPASEPFLERTRPAPGVLLADGDAVAAFEDAGWHWGGRWDEPVDYQHFSARPPDG
jgi:hypothetical protein